MIYAFITWVVANLKHPIILIIYAGAVSGGFVEIELVGAYLFLLIYTLLFSIPSLIFSCLVVYIPAWLPIKPIYKYLLWILIALAIPSLNLFTLKLLDSGFFKEFDFVVVTPASGAVLLAILFRYKAFMNFIAEPAETSIGND